MDAEGKRYRNPGQEARRVGSFPYGKNERVSATPNQVGPFVCEFASSAVSRSVQTGASGGIFVFKNISSPVTTYPNRGFQIDILVK